jgi:hypothetical protein
VKGWKVLVALATLVASATIAAAPAGAAMDTYRYDGQLRWWVHQVLEMASYSNSHGKTIPEPVEVRCYDSRAEFDDVVYRLGGDPRGLIAYYRGGNTIHMRNATCLEAHRFIEGDYRAENVGAFSSLLDEALHRQGFVDEHNTETFALAAMWHAGRLAQWQKYISDTDAGWEMTRPWGDKVLRIAFDQSNRVVAPEYRTAWNEVITAWRQGWAARLGK